MPRAKVKISDASSPETNEKILKLHHIPAYFLIFSLLIAFYFLFATLQPFLLEKQAVIRTLRMIGKN